MSDEPGALPVDPSAFEEPLDQALAVLYNAKIGEGSDWRSSLTISTELRDDYGIPLHWRTIDSLLDVNRELAQRRKRQRRWEYLILSDGSGRIVDSARPITLVDPTNSLTSTLTLHSMLGRLKGEVRICDPYLDAKTIEHLDAIPDISPIKLLTKTVRESGKLRRVLAAAQVSKAALEVRGDLGAPLHDRYVIDSEGMLILGTSLNGFGRKQSFIVQAGPDLAETMKREFDRIWASTPVWP